MTLRPVAFATLLGTLTLATAGDGAVAQSQARLAEMRDGKLQLPFNKSVPWKRDFVAAQAAATRSKKLIFAYFTRSDERCQDSLSLECGAFLEDEFKEFCERVVPYCNITTRVEGDKDQHLFRAKGGELFPYVIFMDASGRVLYRVQGESVADFRKGLDALDEITALKRKVKAGDKQAPYQLLLKQLVLHHIEYPAAKKAYKKVRRMTKEQKAELAPYMFEAEVLHKVGQCQGNVKKRAKLGQILLKRQEKGEEPTRAARIPFWMCVMDYAQQRKKPFVYEDALDALKQEFPKKEFPAQEATLRKMKLAMKKPTSRPRRR